MRETGVGPARLWSLGVAAGILMAVGLVALAGVALRIDDVEAAPGWVWLGFVGWLGIYIAVLEAFECLLVELAYGDARPRIRAGRHQRRRTVDRKTCSPNRR